MFFSVKNPVSILKGSHRQRAFSLLADKRVLARQDIATELGLSQQTAMKIMNYFSQVGLVNCAGEGDSQIGRKPQMYAFNPNIAQIIAAVHEGSVMRIGILNLACEVLVEETVEINGGIHEMLVEIPCEITERLLMRLIDKGIQPNRVLGLGLCLPGVVDDKKLNISFAPSFALQSSYHIGGLLNEVYERLGVPVTVENDVNAAVYGEFTARNTSDLAFISIGSGVGMGLVLDGKTRCGPMFTAGEVGLMPYYKNGDLLTSRSVEDYIALDALKKQFGFDRHFSVEVMSPDAKASMISMVSDVAAYVIVTCATMLNVSDFVLGGLTVELIGDELFKEVQRKAVSLSPFGVKLHKQRLSCPALVGAARKIIDMQMRTLLSLDKEK